MTSLLRHLGREDEALTHFTFQPAFSNIGSNREVCVSRFSLKSGRPRNSCFMDKQISEYLKQIGKKGGEETKKTRGKKYFAEIAKKRWEKDKKMKKSE